MASSQIAKEIINARVSPEKVWAVWERAHAKNGQTQIEEGQKSYSKAEGKSKFKYEILDVIPYRKFSILWKTLFVRLIFTHEVNATSTGCEICYEVEIKGLFGWLIRWMLGNKIRQNITAVLKEIVRQLEHEVKI